MRAIHSLFVLLAACAVDGATQDPGDPGEPADPTPPDDEPPPDDPPPPPNTTKLLYDEWSGCMSFDNFQQANMTGAWNDLAVRGACNNCHVDGSYGFTVSADPETFFQKMSEQPHVIMQYFTLAGNPLAVKPNYALVNVTKAVPPHQEHPAFDVATTGAINALDVFYNLTAQRKAAENCDPPRLIWN